MYLLSLSPERISMVDVLPVSRKWAFMSKGCVFLCRNNNYVGRRGVHCLMPSAHAGCWEFLGLNCGALRSNAGWISERQIFPHFSLFFLSLFSQQITTLKQFFSFETVLFWSQVTDLLVK